MERMEMGLDHHRGPLFPFTKVELVDESPSLKGSISAHQFGYRSMPVIANGRSWQLPLQASSNIDFPAHESFSLLQHSLDMSKAHHASSSGWIQSFQSILPVQGNNWSAYTMNPKESVVPSYVALNAGSLVLDSTRGELVNALKATPKEILEAKALAASRSHSEAERRRRERINAHLATLRTIVPSSVKSDKASLLAEVIDQVKRLKREVSDAYSFGSMPSESDELFVEGDTSSLEKGRTMIRVSLCCDDRPDLMTDLKHALDMLKLRTVKVEMSTLGGRMKNDFQVAPKEDCPENDVSALIKKVEEGLRLVMERSGRGELLQGKMSKKQRLTHSDSQVDG
ncbi:hypothetical protein KP509_21G073100 [Ceratopteris richardii]|uniref:BHLH domain-containing protein n=1 Tax=Ceratopteris richardii TaxID=49495 RepID=A0A8T2SF08_CERRI|nr:hypothetical protein KP509_21G073100 [Ceratopteris richardii]